jgi:tetratricopeptide (TPR) repeat protein
MTKNIFIVLLLIIATSCNDTNEQEKQPTATTIPAGEKQLRDLVLQFPDSLLLKENLVQYFRENGNYTQAIAETEHALQKDTINERLWYIKATLYSEDDDTTQAIKAWEKLVAINPQPEYVMSLGSLYALSKNPLALAMADGLLNAPKANAQNQALFIKGLYYSSIGDKKKAIEFFDNCITVDYTNTLAYREKAICLYDDGKYVDALKVLEVAVEVKKTFEEAYYWMGCCYQKLDKKEQAIQSYQMALQIDANYIEAKDALGKLGVIQ